jgi:cytosine/adenosine deaminase-related metal-dependent hydrolase
MVDELHQALMLARLKDGPLGLTAREALQTATIGGARCLGRQQELGSIEPGKLADLALWRVDGLAGDGIEDPVCTLVFGAASLDRLLVGGRQIVAAGRLLTADADELGRSAALAADTLRARAGL